VNNVPRSITVAPGVFHLSLGIKRLSKPLTHNSGAGQVVDAPASDQEEAKK
jgi:hypothetical protein